MTAAAVVKPAVRASRAWTGPALLLASVVQFFIGSAVLAQFPARPFNLAGAAGLVIIMTVTLTFVAGLGETGNWLVSRFSR